jgi:cytochrome c556
MPQELARRLRFIQTIQSNRPQNKIPQNLFSTETINPPTPGNKMNKLNKLLLLASLGLVGISSQAQEVPEPPVEDAPDAPDITVPEPPADAPDAADADDPADGTRPEHPGRHGRPQGDRPERPEIPDALKEKMDEFKAQKEALREGMKAAIAELDNPTRDDIKAAMEAYREANQDILDAHKSLGQEIKAALEELRPERPEKPALSDEAQALIDQQNELKATLDEKKQELKAALENATKEERQALHQAFREENKELAEQLKALHQQIREAVGAQGLRPELRDNRRPDKEVSRKGERRPAER